MKSDNEEILIAIALALLSFAGAIVAYILTH